LYGCYGRSKEIAVPEGLSVNPYGIIVLFGNTNIFPPPGLYVSRLDYSYLWSSLCLEYILKNVKN